MVSAQAQLEPVAEETVVWQKSLKINGELKECALCMKGKEIGFRIGKREYRILGTPKTLGIPGTRFSKEVMIPLNPIIWQYDEASSIAIDSEKDTITGSLVIPSCIDGTLTIEESELTKSLSQLEKGGGGKLQITVKSGRVDLKNETIPNRAYGFKYNQSQCTLCVEETTPPAVNAVASVTH